MDNQHRKISGYRELTQQEIDLMNEAKQLEAKCLVLHQKIADRLGDQALDPSDHKRLEASQGKRWCAIARTDIETGFMALVRSIAQPQPRIIDQ
ncbi:hypothetical protein ACFO0O_00595 [Cobetia amphilecti]|uniref:Acb2/Tad1 hairpin domain-containing protein n=1 Tax=Cobetia amphilecti TaxID=1055104 RepID=A0ABT6UTN5_9GAMM|nr:hypothetical protein [Cobetia amphilecti]MDI5886074.1 hypothetical protein [Cobetia amphilecti]